MRNQNFSSSEDFTESQNFDRFLNAEDSDAEDKALQTAVNKKMQAKGFYDKKGPTTNATKTYPSYTAASYPGGSASQGYDGYGTGYGGYGGGYTSSYGGGYGDNNTYGGSGNKTGYGGGYGTYGSGYGGTYGSGYGGNNPYSGYDATGYSGSGYGPSGGGGYNNNDDDEDEYNEDEDEDEEKEGGGFELNMKEVMERKAAQKAAKEAEEKKKKEAEEKAKIAAKAALKPSKGGAKDKPKGKGVSFNLGGEIPDDSYNENNQNISHITEEKQDSSESSDMNTKTKNPDKDTKSDLKAGSNSKMLLNMSGDESDRKRENLDSVDDLDSDYGKARFQNKSPAKKEEVSDSYADDFEESSKLGSSDYGKTTFKPRETEKKNEEFEESSNYLNESKEAKFETKKDNNENKATEKAPVNEDYNKTYQNQDYQPVISSLKQNYETRAAKDYVYESLLNDERRRVDKLETQLNIGGDQLKTVQQLVQEKDLTIHKLEAQTQNLQKELDIQRAETQDQAKKNSIYEVENENLQKRIEVLEGKVLELESEKRVLTKDNAEKTRTIKERRDYLEKNFESKALSELRTQHENEKDLLLLRVEELQDENKKYREEVDKIKEDARLYKTSFRQKAESDQEVKKLKQEIVLLELKLKDRDQVKQKRQPEVVEKEKENVALLSGIPELDKETQMQELLIKGFQKENEKLMSENKLLKREIEELHGKIYDENKKVTEMRVKLVNNTDSVLMTDKEIDIETRKMLGAENLVSKNEIQANQAKITQLHKELQSREDTFKQRELEMKYEIDRLRAQKTELEARVGGVDMGSLKKQDEEYKQLSANIEQERRNYENEIRDLRSKLEWYIRNQDSLNAKEEVIAQKNLAIQKLEDDIAKILSDPNTNLEAKSKHFNKVNNEDKKRIKQLERDVENLEEALKKRNPGVYDKMKSQQDESAALKELRQLLKKVQEEKGNLEAQYETKLNDLRQQFDRMKLGYERKSNDQAPSKPGKGNESQEDVEVLKNRIKELEREVEDAKKYYLKKASQLKDTKKGGKVVEKEKSSKTAKDVSKTVQFDIKEDELLYSGNNNKENEKGALNAMADEEKTNLVGRLFNIQSTPIHALLNAFEDYKNNLIKAFEMNNNPLVSSSTQEFSKVVGNSLSGFSQKEDVLQRLKQIEQTVNVDKKDPFPKVDALQKVLYDLVWTEIKKENSALTANTSKGGAKLNNFFNHDQDSDVLNRKVDVLEEGSRKKDEELSIIQQKLGQVMSENAKLQKDKSNLELILQQLPKNPRSLDFATMEKKLEIMERNYKEQELELKNAFRKAYNMDPFQATAETDKLKASYEKEIANLRSALERKNQEIYVFRQEMEVILKELNKLRRSKA